MFEYDEERDHDAHKDAHKPKLTLTECVVALVISYVLITSHPHNPLCGTPHRLGHGMLLASTTYPYSRARLKREQ